jgi:hypothetical protein
LTHGWPFLLQCVAGGDGAADSIEGLDDVGVGGTVREHLVDEVALEFGELGEGSGVWRRVFMLYWIVGLLNGNEGERWDAIFYLPMVTDTYRRLPMAADGGERIWRTLEVAELTEIGASLRNG